MSQARAAHDARPAHDAGQILIEKLDIYAYHGVFAEEERLGQRFLIDLVLDADLRAAASSDDLADTVDYGRAVAIVSEAFTGRRFQLLEAAAKAVADALFAAFPPVTRVVVTLRKPSPPIPATLAAAGIRLGFQRGD
ncbi:dihydroneopterin aldolase [Bosea sp. (in: a-proteobacteria)]|uniref:dihydroneopterin aldolase n=1 Tax=Bosea sp. (in: a-proteobacteria) TaxID=1871050 RepID=UPI001202DD27|nr:dihydroneopterin aldolase [Bosea sp. (in: a-proteobacteria)]TAJ34821.1 MAG: dihydroneopterin aldolase [Bosea sp. (in: a-proteobacteria)]